MLKNGREAPLDLELFQHPPKEYRGAPFWAWNCRIDKGRLDRQISCFKKMGFGGYHIHPRQGLATKYLGAEYMEALSFCIENGKEKDMYSYLYDEDRWPSGYAGGLVTKEPGFRQRVLIVTKDTRFLADIEQDADKAFAGGLPYLVGCYDIAFDEEGFLKEYRRIEVSDKAEHETYYAYSRTDAPAGRYNFQTYVDIMQPAAIRRFIELTHERLYAAFGREYGTWIPSIFTDEPRHETLEQLSEANPERGALYYWTYTFDSSFQEKYGYSLIEHLPCLIWDTPQKDRCYVRYHYFNHAEDLFEQAFFRQIRQVTKKQKLAFTGHLMNEHELLGQIRRTGDAMRLYPYFDIPGIDVLFDRVELTTAKQAQSIVRQYGKKGMLSELYGVTGWDFDFKCLKMQGDWQAALGVTLRVPHLAMMSMEGRAKRDYPASFLYQSPWYEEWKTVEDHFARLNTVLFRGRPLVNVAVLHPIETTMLRLSTKEKSAAFLKQQEKRFRELVECLLYAAIDFDFLNEALLPDQAACADELPYAGGGLEESGPSSGQSSCRSRLRVGRMEYEAVIVPPMDTIRETTIEILERFADHGGIVIFMDQCPQYVDGIKSCRAEALYGRSLYSGPDMTALIGLLKEQRMVRLQSSDGSEPDHLLCQLREDCGGLWLFVARAKKLGKASYERSLLTAEEIRITVKGEYHASVFDTLTGEVRPVRYRAQNGRTAVDYSLFANDSLLLRFDAFSCEGRECSRSLTDPEQRPPYGRKTGGMTLWDEVRYKRSEPNVLLLDVGRYSLDGRTYGEREYVLEMSRQIAERLHAAYSDAQPYVLMETGDKREGVSRMIFLRFEFESMEELRGLSLAAERVEDCAVFLNGIAVKTAAAGYYVDESIRTVPLPAVRKGRNILDIRLPFLAQAGIEPCYLLGEFDVTLKGCGAVIHRPSGTIGFGPLTAQGMPFYGGSVTYSAEIETPCCIARITVSEFKAHCLRVFIDGEDAGLIAFAPFAVEKELLAGTHRLEILCYGNRNNTFGPVHNKRMKDGDYYIEPDAWEKDCEFWRNGYFLQDTGILSGPVIEFFEKKQ